MSLAQNKAPTNIDAQRILAVLSELNEKILYLSYVDAKFVDKLKTEEGAQIAELLGPALIKKLEYQIQQEEIYMSAISSVDGSITAALEDENVKATVANIQKSTKDISRRLRNIPGLLNELRGSMNNNLQLAGQTASDGRGREIKELLNVLNEVHSLFQRSIKTTVEEDKLKKELLQHYQKLEESKNQKKTSMEKELETLQNEKDNTEKSRKEIITRLKAAIENSNEQTNLKLTLIKDSGNRRLNELQENFNQREKNLKKQMEMIISATEVMKKKNVEAENLLRKQKRVKENGITEILGNFDTQISEKYSKKLELESLVKKKQEELQQLKSERIKIEKENERKRQEAEIEYAREALLNERQKRLNNCASVVQAFWRGLTMREEYAKLKKANAKKFKKATKKKGKK